MDAERPADGAPETHPAPFPHPLGQQSAGPAGYPAGIPNGSSNGWQSASFQPPPPEPPRRRSGFFYVGWTVVGVAVGALLVQGTILAVSAVSDFAAEASASLVDTSGTVLSESWEVDGIDVVYVESGGTPCENEYCWEWLLMTQPDCPTATVTVEISENLFGDAQRVVEQSVTTQRVTSVLVETEEGDGDYADITSISCG